MNRSNRGMRWRQVAKTLRPYVLLTIFHLLLAALFTQPLALQASDHTVAADMSCDQYQTIWSFWWMKKAVFELGQNPYWTDFMYYPYGTGLGYHLSPLTALSALVVSVLTGVPINSPLIYNILLFASFVIIGLATFALVRQLTGNVFAAFIASILVAVSPFRLWNLNHLNLLTMGWALWAIHFVLRFLSRPRMRYLLAAVTFFVVVFYTSLTMAAFAGMFILAYIILRPSAILGHASRGRVLKGLAIGSIIAVCFCSVGLWTMHRTDSDWSITWHDAVHYSTNAQSLILPAHQLSRAAQWLGDEQTFGSYIGGQVFMGWLLLLGTSLVLVFGWRRVSKQWLLLAGVFLVLSFGPSLGVGSRRILDGGMPYRWLFEYVPYLGLSRTPMRLAALAHFCLVVYAVQGLAVWLEQRRTVMRRARSIPLMSLGTILITAILFVENTGGAIQTVSLPIPAVYRQVKHNADVKAIFEMPLTSSSQRWNLYLYCQTYHEKKMANGFLTRASRTARTLLDQIVSPGALAPADRKRLASAGIDVIVHHYLSGDGELIPLP